MSAAIIEVKGRNGESIHYDGSFVRKFRYDGKEESAVNPASTYRECQVKAKKRKGDAGQEFDVLLACQAFFALTIPESEKPNLDGLVAALEAQRA